MTPTTSDHPNAIRIRDVYAKWLTGVVSPMVSFLSDDVVYHLPGRHLGGGETRGIDELMGRGRAYGRTMERTWPSEILDVIANDVFAITFERYRAQRNGIMLDQVVCGVWCLAGGRCVEVWSHFEDQAMVDRFWA